MFPWVPSGGNAKLLLPAGAVIVDINGNPMVPSTPNSFGIVQPISGTTPTSTTYTDTLTFLSSGTQIGIAGSSVAKSITFSILSVPASALPNPSSSTLGGVQSATAASHNWMTGISTSGVPQYSQPAFSDVSGTIATGQVPTLNQNTSGSAASLSATLAIGSGGTGQTSAGAAFAALAPLTTKGDISTYTTTTARLAVGSDTYVLTADSTQATGIKWAPPGGGNSFGVLTGTSGSATAASATDTATFSSNDRSMIITGSSKNMDFSQNMLGYLKQNPYFYDDFNNSNGENTSGNAYYGGYYLASSGSIVLYPGTGAHVEGRNGVIVLATGASASSVSALTWSYNSYDRSTQTYTFSCALQILAVPIAGDDFTVCMGIGQDPWALGAYGSIYFIAARANSTSATNWVCRCQTPVGPTTSDMDSGVAWDTGWHVFTFVMGASNVKFYIDGALVATNTGTLPINTTSSFPAIAIANISETVAHKIYLDYVFFQSSYGTTRYASP